MNKDIEVMLELQRFWDGVIRGNNEIEKCKKEIKNQEKKIDEISTLIEKERDFVKNLKISLKDQEIKLSELEENYKRLEKQKYNIQNERELSAIEKEIKKIEEEKDKLEEDILIKMDNISDSDQKIVDHNNSLSEVKGKFDKDKPVIDERINRFMQAITQYKENFDNEIVKLSPGLRAKFEKLTKSSNGKSIVKVENSICTNCNFTLPSDLNSRLNKNEVINCLNCGKFIYK